MLDGVDRANVERLFREHYAKVLAALIRTTRDFFVAEDALQDSFMAALDVWTRDGLPRSPAAWLLAVARNRALNVRRHEAVASRVLARTTDSLGAREILLDRSDAGYGDQNTDDVPDERLRLIFCACHPALGNEARIALALQTICGLSVGAIAHLFLVSEGTVAQRLVRAKRKIRDAAIPFELPTADRFDERLDAVCSVVYLLFTEGYAPADGDLTRSAPLCEEAIRLGRVLCLLLPNLPEVEGLLSLMLLHHARRDARLDGSGESVALQDQDRTRWDAGRIADGLRHLEDALGRGRPGPYQIQGAIAALHATAARPDETDWVQIMALYEELWRRAPSPSVALALVVAEAMAFSAELALERMERLERSGALAGLDRVAAVRADLLLRAGRSSEARAAYAIAVAQARNEREARFLERRAQMLEP